MSTFGYAYRRRLQEYLDGGSFKSEPAREKVLRTFVDAWEKWAQLASKEQKILRAGQKWMWAGIIPGVVIFFYGVWFGHTKVNAQYKILQQAQDAVTNYRSKHGASSVENEAIQSVAVELAP